MENDLAGILVQTTRGTDWPVAGRRHARARRSLDGPYNGDAAVKAGQIREVVVEAMPMLAEAVESVVAKAAAQMGTARQARNARPVHVNTIVETTNAPTVAPAGMVEIKLSEVFALAGIDCGELPDAVGYATASPTTWEQAIALLANMSLTVPR